MKILILIHFGRTELAISVAVPPSHHFQDNTIRDACTKLRKLVTSPFLIIEFENSRINERSSSDNR